MHKCICTNIVCGLTWWSSVDEDFDWMCPECYSLALLGEENEFFTDEQQQQPYGSEE
jgi:hypothetical protein